MQGTKFLVIGVGKYGREIARKLADKGAEVYAFDNDEQKIDLIKDEIALGVTLDATNIKVLQSQNVTDVDAVVVSIGENFEATILTCVQLMELGVERIIARASGPQQIKILKKIGVTEILAPEDEVADAVAERLLNPSLVRFLQLPDNYEIARHEYVFDLQGNRNPFIDSVDYACFIDFDNNDHIPAGCVLSIEEKLEVMDERLYQVIQN